MSQPPQRQEKTSRIGSCWSCRLLSAAALLGAGWWVSKQPRSALALGAAPNMWQWTQIAFAIGLASWGLVTVANPQGSR